MSIVSIDLASALRKAVVGLVVIVLAACSQSSPEQLLSSAKDYLAKGDKAAAIIQLKNLLQSAPDNGEARLLLGQAQIDSREFENAEKELRRAMELRQPHEKVVPLLARALFSLGKYDDVISEVQKRNLFDPSAVATTQTVLGDAYARLRQSERATAAYTVALTAVPGYPRARLGLAIASATEGKLDDALKQVDEIIAADPKLAEAHAFKSDLLLVKGDRNGATKSLEQAIATDASFLPARFSLISVLIDEKAYEKAAEQLNATRKIAPRDIRVNFYESTLAFSKGESQKARDQVQQVLAVVPNHVPSLVLAGTLEVQLSQFASAESYLRRAVALSPGHVGARRALVAAQLRMGQPVRAKETLQPLVERGFPKDTQLLLLAGETYLANGDVKQATVFYQAAATTTDAQQVAAKTRLGQIALATGRDEEGFKELEAAAALGVDKDSADLALISAHLQREDFDKAMMAVQALEKKQPQSPLTFQMYGVVHLGKKDLAAARRNFEKALELQSSYVPAARILAQLDIQAKRPEDARKRYEAMIAKDDKNDQLYLLLADLQAKTGADAKAVGETLQRAVAANPQSVAARLALINLHLRNKDTKAALAAAQSAISAMPSDPRILDATGFAQEAAGEINQAIETFNKLAAIQPKAVHPLYRLASLYVRQKETDKAIDSLRRVQKISPQERDVVPELVRVYLAADRHEAAIKEARELQKREPKFAGGYTLEADVYLGQRKFAEAERLYRQALTLEPKGNAVAIKLHAALLRAGKTAEADALAKKWIAQNPKDAAMRFYLGDRELAAKNLKASAAHYEAVIENAPTNALALNNLAWIAGELGDPKAIGYAERAVKLAPNSATVLDTYGMLLVKRGEVEKGISLLEQAHKLEPGRNDLRLNYAKALIKSGKKGDARKELEALRAVKENFKGKDEVAVLLKSL